MSSQEEQQNKGNESESLELHLTQADSQMLTQGLAEFSCQTFSQESVGVNDDDDLFVESSTSANCAGSQSILLPGLGSTPSGSTAKRTMPSQEEDTDSQTPNKRMKEQEEFGSSFDLDYSSKDTSVVVVGEKTVDSSIEIINESRKEPGKSETKPSPTKKDLTNFALPARRLLSLESNNQDSSGSDTIFTRIRNVSETKPGSEKDHVSESNDSPSSEELAKLAEKPVETNSDGSSSQNGGLEKADTPSTISSTPLNRLSSSPNEEQLHADDEASESFTKISDLSGNHLSHLKNHISTSPIIHPESEKKKADCTRISSSTPVIRSPRKRQLLKKSKEAEEATKKSPSSEDEKPDEKKKRRMSPRKKDEVPEKSTFKIPQTEKDQVSFFVIACSEETRTEISQHLKAFLKDKQLVHPFLEVKVAKDQSSSAYERLKNFSHQSPSSQRRLSTSSSFSRSSSNSGNSGYLADGSSGSEGSKRDRLSIAPEMTVQPHMVVSPLPTSLNRKVLKKDVSDIPPKPSPAILPAIPENKALSDVKRKRKDSRKESEPSDQNQENQTDSLFKDGEKVFAKYMEGLQFRYWPAKIDSLISDDKWKVKFEDGKEKDLPSEELIPASKLMPEHRISVNDEDGGVFNTGILVGFPDLSQKGKIGYQVSFDRVEGIPQIEEKLVSFTDVFLDADQAKAIKRDLGGRWMTPSVPKADLDLSNIIHTSRRSRKTSTPTSTPVSTPNRRRKKGGENVETSETDAESPKRKGRKAEETPGARRGNMSSVRKRIISTSEEEAQSTSKPRGRGRGRRPSKEVSKVDIFKGLTFVITKGSRKESGESQTEDTMDTETESETQGGGLSESPFLKNDLKQKILDNGGQVLDQFPGEKQALLPQPDLIILSDQAQETMTFLLSIAYGYPRLHYRWIHDSVAQKCLQSRKNYVLPVGYSSLEKRQIEQNEFGTLTSMMEGKNILVTSEEQDFINDWKPLLSRLGATVCSRRKGKLDRNLRTVDLVIADRDSPESILSDAKTRKIPVVNSKWVIQSLINGRIVDFDAFRV